MAKDSLKNRCKRVFTTETLSEDTLREFIAQLRDNSAIAGKAFGKNLSLLVITIGVFTFLVFAGNTELSIFGLKLTNVSLVLPPSHQSRVSTFI